MSPLLSNIMLNELDKELENRGQRFTRYADDVVIALKSKAAATRVMYSITDWIEMIRVIIWKQWKTTKKREWGLLKLGVEKWVAHKVASWGDHYQLIATKSVVARAISKEILIKRGLVSILDYYQMVAHI